MTLAKMLELISTLKLEGFKLRGCSVYATGSGELALELNTQPDGAVDRHLRSKGFIVNDSTYIYRPRRS